MNKNDGAVQAFFATLTDPTILLELFAILISALVAIALAGFLRAWYRRGYGSAHRSGFSARVLDATVIVLPILLTLGVLFAVYVAFAAKGLGTGLLNRAMQLTAALLVVRFGVYLLRQLLGEDSWLKGWQNQFTFVVWLAVAFELLGWFERVEGAMNNIDLLPGKETFTVWELLKTLVIISIIVMATSLIARTIERRVMKMTALAMSTRLGISKFSYFFLITLGLLLGFNAAGVDFTALTLLTGAIGVGLGFGLQAIASNFLSGFVLLMDKSIKPGDVISFTSAAGPTSGGFTADNFGWVQELRGRYIVVRDRDGIETLVPNQFVITNSVINWSYSDARVRLRLPVMISYRDDPEKALLLLQHAAADHPRILREPGPVTRLMSFEDYGMRLEVRFWIADPMNGVNNVRSDVNRAIVRLFREAGITIPVAQRELRMLPALDNDHPDLAPARDT
ncbi:MAG TPA: mechanosensitive ion channel [Steroidobacteraceae bacterium]|jgi:small-conductance mechanosensitive channel|nr:mechanosensitive ion channel [Steroidobacteraceae bacterium]HNS28678.1 mechanosensitive ion channel [Steroidobacteraceae bacterium]